MAGYVTGKTGKPIPVGYTVKITHVMYVRNARKDIFQRSQMKRRFRHRDFHIALRAHRHRARIPGAPGVDLLVCENQRAHPVAGTDERTPGSDSRRHGRRKCPEGRNRGQTFECQNLRKKGIGRRNARNRGVGTGEQNHHDQSVGILL